MKTILPWLLAVVMLAAAAFFFSTNRKLATENATLRESESHAQALRTELEEIKKTGTPEQNEEITKLRKDTQDLLKLRNEVRQLRAGTQELASQAQKAQAQADAARSQVQNLSTNLQAAQATAAQQAQVARAAVQVAAQQQVQDTARACINNLRIIDGAMQQWALEYKKDVRAIPTATDLAAYMPSGVIPKCPAGGAYTTRSVGEVPTCSLPGHALPAQ